MIVAKTGDRVRVHYTGRLEDGTVFDSSRELDPLEFVLGRGDVIPGFDQAVSGMAPGECKTVTILPEQAYGPHQEEMVACVPIKDLGISGELTVGQQLEVTQEEGPAFLVMVAALDEETVTLDANHPLAGRNLVFDLELLAIG
ncbi:peptidyl-prolyl cis-trans isomerase [Desulfuromonas versatilis]|uniref:Peptidyl-prolyl cis-trans isomerase n=1 Tax=Desulfuromonas versatilis TaxID=2802975 RepID=A0ABN6DUN4_9BACT|nr:peptidyl-prolyl cis-trans isomerase [Desulfuromonas versatilis]